MKNEIVAYISVRTNQKISGRNFSYKEITCMDSMVNITIGKASTGEDYKISLQELSNIFISYSYKEQLVDYVLGACSNWEKLIDLKQVSLHADPFFTAAFEQNSSLRKTPLNTINLLPATFDESSDHEFIVRMHKLFKRRQKNVLEGKADDGTVIVFIGNIFNIINKKKIGLMLINLLLNAKEANMFFIIGSPGMHKNLLNQLLHLKLSVKETLRKQMLANADAVSLGRELIITADNLLFLMERNSRDYMKLYPPKNLMAIYQ